MCKAEEKEQRNNITIIIVIVISLNAPVPLDESFPSTVLVANVPKVGKEKYDKLIGMPGKIIDKYGPKEKLKPGDRPQKQGRNSWRRTDGSAAEAAAWEGRQESFASQASRAPRSAHPPDMYIYIYIYICIHCVYIDICICIEREM